MTGDPWRGRAQAAPDARPGLHLAVVSPDPAFAWLVAEHLQARAPRADTRWREDLGDAVLLALRGLGHLRLMVRQGVSEDDLDALHDLAGRDVQVVALYRDELHFRLSFPDGQPEVFGTRLVHHQGGVQVYTPQGQQASLLRLEDWPP